MSGTGEPNPNDLTPPSGTNGEPNTAPSGTDTAAEIQALKEQISELRKEAANYRTKAKGKETIEEQLKTLQDEFDKTKREKEQRKNQKIVELKEVQLSMTIEQHDIDIKAKNALKFLNNGDKVKVSIRMSGRQQAYFERGIETENKFAESLEEVCVIEKPAKVEGRNIIMILAPKNAKK